MPDLDITPLDDPLDVPRTDAELILGVRDGDPGAADELYRRHHRAALAFADSLAGPTLGPDLVSDAFMRILDVLRRGGGPTFAFRSYLYTSVRNVYVDHVRRNSRQISVPDFSSLEAEFAFEDGADERFEQSTVLQAFRSLPQRWQAVLWYTSVEGENLDDAGRMLGLTSNAVAALSFRAREGLRQAYLAAHLNLVVEGECAEVWEALPKYIRGTLRARALAQVERHVPDCRRCSTAVVELETVNTGLRALLLPLLLGPATAGALSKVLGDPADPAPENANATAAQAEPTAPWWIKVAGVVAAGAAVGALALAWPEGRGPASGRAAGAEEPAGQRSPTIEELHTRPDQRPTRVGPSGGTEPDRVPAGVPGADPVDATMPGSTGFAFGVPATARLTKTSPSWHHVSVPLAGPSGGRRPTLVVRTAGISAAHVHREPGFAPWVCTADKAAATGSLQWRCVLEGAVNSAFLDLDIDLRAAATGTVQVTAYVDGAVVARREVAVGSDAARG